MVFLAIRPHLHILCLDGVFSEVGEGENTRIKFRNVPTLSDLDTENILEAITTKILKHLRRKGYLSPAGDVVQNPELILSLLITIRWPKRRRHPLEVRLPLGQMRGVT